MAERSSISAKTGNLNIFILGKWAALCVQLIGYFPLTSRISKPGVDYQYATFQYSWKRSIFPYFSCFLSAASFTWCFMYFLRYSEFKSFIDAKSPTEVGAFNLMILTSTISGICLRILGLKNGGNYQHFWGQTNSLFNHFKPKINNHEYEQFYREFYKIGISCWCEIILMTIPILIHVSYLYGWPLVRAFLKDLLSSSHSLSRADMQLLMGLGFWSFTTLLHIGNAIWMSFFIKIYTSCLNSISSELHNLNLKTKSRYIGVPSFVTENYGGVKANPHHQLRVDSHSELRAILDKLALVDDEIVRFNDFFGNPLLIQVGNCVINLLAFAFFACLWMGRGQWVTLLQTVVPLFLHGKELLDLGSVAENLSAASDKVLEALGKDVILDNLSEELYLKIQILSVQLCTKPPIVSARQFFTINRGLVTSVMSALATFLVVLVQFKDQDDEDAKRVSIAPNKTSVLGNINTNN